MNQQPVKFTVEDTPRGTRVTGTLVLVDSVVIESIGGEAGLEAVIARQKAKIEKRLRTKERFDADKKIKDDMTWNLDDEEWPEE